MAQVDFYILGAASPDAATQFACRLIAKAERLEHRVHVRMDNDAALEQLDQLLWTFRDDSFIAHDRWPADEVLARVTLGVAADGLPQGTEVCVNLAASVVPECPRIAEIIAANDADKAAGRERFSHYRERGCELQTHQLGSP